MQRETWYSRENGSQLNYHKGFKHEGLRGDLTTEKPREAEKKISVFISKNTVHEAKEEAKKTSKPALVIGE